MLRGSGSTGSLATCRERESMIWSGQSRARCCSCSTTATAATRPERAASTKSYSSTSMAPTTAYNLLNEYWNAMNYDDEVVQVTTILDHGPHGKIEDRGGRRLHRSTTSRAQGEQTEERQWSVQRARVDVVGAVEDREDDQREHEQAYQPVQGHLVEPILSSSSVKKSVTLL